MIKHNKKRNTLLLYEFLSYSLAKSALDSNKSQFNLKLGLIKEFFSKSTNLYKELNLMRTLSEAYVSSDSTAEKILDRTRDELKNINFKKLNKEKTKLINKIHNDIADSDFYGINVSEYKKFATIQNVLNEYYAGNTDYTSSVNTTLLESNLKNYMLEEKVEKVISHEDKKIYNNLTTRIIINKFNEKYKNLNELQRKIMINYTFNNGEEFKHLLESSKKIIIEHIDKIKNDQEIKNDKELFEKLLSVDADVKKITIDDDFMANENSILEFARFAEIMDYREEI